MTAALQAVGLSVSFGSLAAVRSLDLTLMHGERHALIGPNGAGKTTVINLLAGALAADRGIVTLDGNDITKYTPDERVRCGLVRTFQINSLFPELSAWSSLVMVISEREGLGSQWWRAPPREKHVLDEAGYWLNRLELLDVKDVPAAHLPYGQQRLLEIALALACRPRVLLLDEPAAGLPARESHAMLDVINALPDDITVLLVEHDMDLVFGFAQTISVLDHGQVIACGAPDHVAADEQVRAVYLGTDPSR